MADEVVRGVRVCTMTNGRRQVINISVYISDCSYVMQVKSQH